MSSESIPANEYPDRVGFKPDNPYLTTFRPFIPANVSIAELTPRAIIVGTLLGVVFGASSLYLVLKVGLTVSASIPVAVISITLFGSFQNSEYVMPQFSKTILANYQLSRRIDRIWVRRDDAGDPDSGFDLDLTRVMLVAVLGSLLGILMMIPLRRALIVAQHGYKIPEVQRAPKS